MRLLLIARSRALAGKILENVADQEHQDSDAGQLELVTHSVRLGDADVKCESHVGASQRLQNFAQDIHTCAASRVRC